MAHEWLDGLRKYGIIISRPVMAEAFPDGPAALDPSRIEGLRAAYRQFEAGASSIEDWLWAIANGLIGIENRPLLAFGEEARKHLELLPGMRGLAPPDGLLLSYFEGSLTPRIFIWTVGDGGKRAAKWERTCAEAQRFIRENQRMGVRLGLVTDGLRLRLYHVDLEGEAWMEWDASNWFEEAGRQDEMLGFALMLDKGMLGIGSKDEPRLEVLARQSRRKQGDISSRLGERLRRAVEEMMNKVVNSAVERSRTNQGRIGPLEMVAMNPDGSRLSETATLQALYQAAIRVVMRLVFISYAESRDLLPLDARTYAEGYSLQSLYELLDRNRRAVGTENMRTQCYAWPRILALFSLIYSGCRHNELYLQQYGGELFSPPSPSSPDAVLRALTLFEDRLAMTDADVLELLDYIRRGGVKGAGGIEAGGEAIDFSDLRTEYIGIMYEGFLDFFPKLVHEEDIAYVELKGKGDHAYPLARLEEIATDRARLRDFLKKVREGSKRTDELLEESEAEEEEQAEEEEGEEDEGEVTIETFLAGPRQPTGLEARVHRWATEAAKAARLIRDSASVEEQERAVASLVKNVYGPGKVFLISWKGLRKGSGTYYTRPGLVIPLVRRTLEALVLVDEGTKEPRRPEEIVALEVVDPAMGSGSFLVASANYLAEELYHSWKYHGYMERLANGERLLLPDGRPATGLEEEDIVALSPNGSGEERFEEYLLTRLKRHVIERCIYGVDINPLAVELAKLSLWLETMDPHLPFEFLDHKLKVGNSLVGTWLFEAFDYPIAAWDRYENVKTDETNPLKVALLNQNEWIKKAGKECKEELKKIASGLSSAPLFGIDSSALSRQVKDRFESVHRARERDRARLFDELTRSEDYQRLKRQMDRWCAIWFWPGKDEFREEDVPLPSWFYRTTADEDNVPNYVARQVAQEMHFFHWEVEFPDVFIRENPGFDAAVGNPPWDRVKPESVPFFARHDLLYPTYDKQAALKRAAQMFEQDMKIKGEWIATSLETKNMTYWAKSVRTPFAASLGGGRRKESDWDAHIGRRMGDQEAWYQSDEGGRSSRPFSLQGEGDVNLYKLFAEQGLFLTREKGRMGMVLPGAVYSDHGAKELRKAFLDNYDWEWLFSFENRLKIFPVDSRYIFCCIVLQEGKEAEELRTAFMVHELERWGEEGFFGVRMGKDMIKRFSPWAMMPPAVNDEMDLRIMDKIYSKGRLIGDPERKPRIQYATEFHMTNDSNLFKPREWWERKGFIRDPFGFWINKEGEIGLPLIEGKAIWIFDPFYAEHVSGNRWKYLPWHRKIPNPQYVMSSTDYSKGACIRGAKLGFRDISNSTNERSMISSIGFDFPNGNNIPILYCQSLSDMPDYLNFIEMASLKLDYTVRNRMTGTHLNRFIINELVLNDVPTELKKYFALYQMGLNCPLPIFAAEWSLLRNKYDIQSNWTDNWFWADMERLKRFAALDTALLASPKLDCSEYEHILKIDESNRRGFHRTDRDLVGDDQRWRYCGLVQEVLGSLSNYDVKELQNILMKPKLPEKAIEVRDNTRGVEWRGWQPNDRLSRKADRECIAPGDKDRPSSHIGNTTSGNTQSGLPRYAIHVHRDALISFINTIESQGFNESVQNIYHELWGRVWEIDPEKTDLTWRDCDAYSKCVLSLIKPEGAYDRLLEVISDRKPYRYIYDPDIEAKMDEAEDKAKRKKERKKKSSGRGEGKVSMPTLESYMK